MSTACSGRMPGSRRAALAQGRLVNVLAGIQHDAHSRTFTVFFVQLEGI
ncbi:hypothetical protein ACRCF9_25965 [Pseudomonas canadensis]|nr:hypothetical protein [Pseudomonas sp. C 49-2]